MDTAENTQQAQGANLGKRNAKKLKRARKRRRVALTQEDEAKIDSIDESNSRSDSFSLPSQEELIKLDSLYKKEEERVSKREKTIFPLFKEEKEQKPHKKHSGLRCNKCFDLLCKREEFSYENGKIIIPGDKANVIRKGNRVLCCKLHQLGYVEERKNSITKRKEVLYALSHTKTTYKANFT